MVINTEKAVNADAESVEEMFYKWDELVVELARVFSELFKLYGNEDKDELDMPDMQTVFVDLCKKGVLPNKLLYVFLLKGFADSIIEFFNSMEQYADNKPK